MSAPELTQARLKELLSYDTETGQFTWLVTRGKRAKAGSIAGSGRHDGYIHIKVNYKPYLAHRLAFLWVTGEMPPEHVDHVNMIKSDNRWSNLRTASSSENKRNMGKLASNTSGYKGVTFNKRAKKFKAEITIQGQKIYLRCWKSAEQAAAAYAIACNFLNRYTNTDFYRPN